MVLALSRTGAADISFSQNFVAPGGTAEVGVSTLSVGYALTPQWRIATDVQRQNSPPTGKVALECIWSGNPSNVSWAGNLAKLVGKLSVV
ncbi:hypothetical protein NON20_07560 [Synechocystis sp. B12]|nr:hypothetical protein NON20_07560 [Synechocystis sp. B12]